MSETRGGAGSFKGAIYRPICVIHTCTYDVHMHPDKTDRRTGRRTDTWTDTHHTYTYTYIYMYTQADKQKRQTREAEKHVRLWLSPCPAIPTTPWTGAWYSLLSEGARQAFLYTYQKKERKCGRGGGCGCWVTNQVCCCCCWAKERTSFIPRPILFIWARGYIPGTSAGNCGGARTTPNRRGAPPAGPPGTPAAGWKMRLKLRNVCVVSHGVRARRIRNHQHTQAIARVHGIIPPSLICIPAAVAPRSGPSRSWGRPRRRPTRRARTLGGGPAAPPASCVCFRFMIMQN